MRVSGIGASLAVLTLLLSPAAARAELGSWFMTATQLQAPATVVKMATPDFMGGTTMSAMHCGATGVPIGNGIWVLQKYDTVHGIGLAAASTDQCSVALFEAAAPGFAAKHADLSGYKTGRGIGIGSSFSSVTAAYGSAKKGAGTYVVAYGAGVPSRSVTGKRIELPETIKLVMRNDRVRSIAIEIDEGGMTE